MKNYLLIFIGWMFFESFCLAVEIGESIEINYKSKPVQLIRVKGMSQGFFYSFSDDVGKIYRAENKIFIQSQYAINVDEIFNIVALGEIEKLDISEKRDEITLHLCLGRDALATVASLQKDKNYQVVEPKLELCCVVDDEFFKKLMNLKDTSAKI
ncbi:MAG: hypothetical protein KC505_08735 [Myxococcales bacterium]|nr:hypothetical protein [Myxococcales bacterium]USN51401.1 MAG: hypothetical protein H6731_03050 [Myxococcales bacterium]